MSFIAIDAKADISENKKGKLTPAQHAQFNAFCLTKKTGILDCLGKCEYISPISIDSANHKATITFNSGYVVICGRLVECEAGTTFVADLPVSGEETGYIVLRYDLSAFEENEFKVIQKTGSLTQQDLNNNPIDGVYEFVLYKYTATPTSITLTRENNFSYIPEFNYFFTRGNVENQVVAKKPNNNGAYFLMFYNEDGRRGIFDGGTGATNVAPVEIDRNNVVGGLFNNLIATNYLQVGDSNNFGSISLNGIDLETRLNNLGFKSGYLGGLKSTSPQIAIKKQGKYAIISFVANTVYLTPNEFVSGTILSMPTIDGFQFKSKYTKTLSIMDRYVGSSGLTMNLYFTAGSSNIRLYWGQEASVFTTDNVDIGIELE